LKVAQPTRSADSRTATARPAISGPAVQSRLHIDPALLDSSLEYQWIRESTLGERDEGNLQVAMDVNGFTPVEAKTMPGVAGRLLPGQKALDGLIRRGGLVLMARSREWADAAAQDMAAFNAQQVASVTKDLSASLDGKNWQEMPGAGVVSAVDRGDGERTQRFSE
jgi:hypothetical protein